MIQTEAERIAGERRRRLLKYFIEAPDPHDLAVARAFLIISVALTAGTGAAYALMGTRNSMGGGLVLAAICGAVGLDKLIRYRRQVSRSHPRPSHREMDSLLANELGRIQSTALEKLEITPDDLELAGLESDPLAHLHESSEVRNVHNPRPLVVIGPVDDAYVEIGSDGVWRFSEYHVMVICPTRLSLGLYVCTVDILTGAVGWESTREYHYDDVVAILTTTVGEVKPAHLLRDGEVHFARRVHRELRIVSSSGDEASIPVLVPTRGEAERATVEWARIEDVIAAVRRVLREHKSTERYEPV